MEITVNNSNGIKLLTAGKLCEEDITIKVDIEPEVETVTQATPTISVSSNGLITASATQSAGYVEAGTKSSTKQLTTQESKTIIPSTNDQTAISDGIYAIGSVIVKGDSNLIPSNIKNGVSIFGVTGTYKYSNVYLNGPYIFNEEIIFPTGEIEQNITFTSNGVEYVKIRAVQMETNLYYVTSSGTEVLVYSEHDSSISGIYGYWAEAEYMTVDLGTTAQSVDGSFYEWFVNNATIYGDDIVGSVKTCTINNIFSGTITATTYSSETFTYDTVYEQQSTIPNVLIGSVILLQNYIGNYSDNEYYKVLELEAGSSGYAKLYIKNSLPNGTIIEV